MTREEQIRKASIEYTMSTNPVAIGGDAFADMIEAVNVNPTFIAGAKWADEHPKEPPLPSDIDEAAKDFCASEYDLACLSNNDYKLAIRDFKAGAEWRDKQIPKLPDNVDEAAEEYGKKNPVVHNPTFDTWTDWEESADNFKAGAKWVAEQGETLETIVHVNGVGQPYIGSQYLKQDYREGDKVIVQIRKK